MDFYLGRVRRTRALALQPCVALQLMRSDFDQIADASPQVPAITCINLRNNLWRCKCVLSTRCPSQERDGSWQRARQLSEQGDWQSVADVVSVVCRSWQCCHEPCCMHQPWTPHTCASTWLGTVHKPLDASAQYQDAMRLEEPFLARQGQGATDALQLACMHAFMSMRVTVVHHVVH